MSFSRISIIGVGLLGGSIGLSVKSRHPNSRILGFGHRPETLKKAQHIGAIDEVCLEFTQAARADLIILATPVLLFKSVLEQLAPHLAPGTIITDVGSTKRSVVALAEKILPKTVHFVGSHPMAGSEKRGVEFARTDLLDQAVCLITPTKKTKLKALKQVEQFWQDLGMTTTRLSPKEHDRLLADVSHLPHALAAALVRIQHDPGLGLAGKGFLDTTRIAGGDANLWRDIFLDNRDNLRQSLSRLQREIERLMKMLEKNDPKAIATWLDQATKKRDEVLKRKLREMNPD